MQLNLTDMLWWKGQEIRLMYCVLTIKNIPYHSRFGQSGTSVDDTYVVCFFAKGAGRCHSKL